MGKLLKIKEAAQYLRVSQDTLRKWDKANKLKPLKTPGGHRKYDTDVLDNFLGREHVSDYGKLYKHLLNAQDIAFDLQDEQAVEIKKIRINIGDKLLKLYNIK